jgi:hypothetical protein
MIYVYNIHIVDDFLNHAEIEHLNQILLKKNYKYGHTSGYREQITIPFFSYYNEDDFFLIYLKEKIEKKFKENYKVNSHYMHIQTFGQDGSFHIDDEGENTFTFCLYITEEKELDQNGGDFLIKIPTQKYIFSIETNFNRGIMFPSYYLHKGLAYNKSSDKQRLCITWKLEKI